MELWKKPHELLSMFNENPLNPLNPYLFSRFFSMWEEAEEEGCELI
jgi:hypothetical protein